MCDTFLFSPFHVENGVPSTDPSSSPSSCPLLGSSPGPKDRQTSTPSAVPSGRPRLACTYSKMRILLNINLTADNEVDENTLMVQRIGEDGWIKRKSPYRVGFGNIAHGNSAHCLQPDKCYTIFIQDEGNNLVIYFDESYIIKADFDSIYVEIFACRFFIIWPIYSWYTNLIHYASIVIISLGVISHLCLWHMEIYMYIGKLQKR